MNTRESRKSAPFYSNVSSKYGAPMGRRSDKPEDFGNVRGARLVRVPFVDGDYDPGGAYWGGGTPLYCAWGDDDVRGERMVAYVRAPSREAAKAKFPKSTTWKR